MEIYNYWITPTKLGVIVEIKPKELSQGVIKYPKWGEVSPTHKAGDNWIGNYITSNTSEIFRVLRWVGKKKGHNYYEVQSAVNNYVATIPAASFHSGKIGNPYLPTSYGVGYFGKIEGRCEYYEKVKSMWRSMLSRCYNTKNHNYPNYGGRGIHVCERWLSLEMFYKDCKNLLGWREKCDNWASYSLDKDLLGGNYYGPDNCLFLDKSGQSLNVGKSPFVEITLDYGDKFVYETMKAAAEDLHVSCGNLCSVKHGKRKCAKSIVNARELRPKTEGNILRWFSKETLWMLRDENIDWSILKLLDKLQVEY